jgi:hypothetical protein
MRERSSQGETTRGAGPPQGRPRLGSTINFKVDQAYVGGRAISASLTVSMWSVGCADKLIGQRFTDAGFGQFRTWSDVLR